jgi:hypothetical protein
MDATDPDSARLRRYYLRELADAAVAGEHALGRLARFARHLAAEDDDLTDDRAVDERPAADAAPAPDLPGPAGSSIRSVVPEPEPAEPEPEPEPEAPAGPGPAAAAGPETVQFDPDRYRADPEAPAPPPAVVAVPPRPRPDQPRVVREPGAHRADGTGPRGRRPRPRPDPGDDRTAIIGSGDPVPWPTGTRRPPPSPIRRTVTPDGGTAPIDRVRDNGGHEPLTDPAIRPGPGIRQSPDRPPNEPGMLDRIRWYLGI